MSKPKPTVESKVEYWCQTCNLPDAMTANEIRAHLRTAHGLNEFKGTRRGVSFLDGEDGFYQQTYDLNIGGVKLTKIAIGQTH